MESLQDKQFNILTRIISALLHSEETSFNSVDRHQSYAGSNLHNTSTYRTNYMAIIF
jgi:hypothetical protein